MIHTTTRCAAALAAVLTAVPTLAADGEVLWGRQTALGDFETKKVDLSRVATITDVTMQWRPPKFCIKAGQPYPENVVCWDKDDPSLVGTTLPAGKRYFVVPEKRTNNSPAYVQITVEY